MSTLLHFLLNIDKELLVMVNNYGAITYAIMFLIIFCETGLVFIPFLPGDSLLFASGAVAAIHSLNIVQVYSVYVAAAIIGDAVNYKIGEKIGRKIISKKDGQGRMYFKLRENFKSAEKFYRKYGTKAVVIGRFVPIIRAFIPFTAGICKMKFDKFIKYDIVGGVLWTGIFVGSGYIFGNIDIVKSNFHYITVFIILLSVIPVFILYRKTKNDSIM